MTKNSFVAEVNFNEDSGNVIFSCNELRILNIDINNINLDNNFDEDDPDNIIYIRLLPWHIKFEKHRKLFWTENYV